jgi:hypothetical protein
LEMDLEIVVQVLRREQVLSDHVGLKMWEKS